MIRNRQDRRFICPEVGKTKLETSINKHSKKQEITLEVPKKGSQKARQADIEIKYTYGLIPIRAPSLYGSKDTERKISDTVAVYVIRAKEMNPPGGVEAIDWTLLTNIPVSNFEEAIERVNWYKLR